MTRGERLIPYLFLLPAFLFLLVFRIFPAFAGFREALYINALSMGTGRIFVGFENYTYLFDDPVFWKSLGVTLLFSAIINPLQTILAL
jgi:multiple sugar transport system permease protein